MTYSIDVDFSRFGSNQIATLTSNKAVHRSIVPAVQCIAYKGAMHVLVPETHGFSSILSFYNSTVLRRAMVLRMNRIDLVSSCLCSDRWMFNNEYGSMIFGWISITIWNHLESIWVWLIFLHSFRHSNKNQNLK